MTLNAADIASFSFQYLKKSSCASTYATCDPNLNCTATRLLIRSLRNSLFSVPQN